MNSKESYKVNKCLKPIKSNQIKSSCLGIALGSRIQGEVSIHYVLRFFSLDLYKICVPITLARFENIKTLRITHTNKPPPLGKMSFSVMLIFRNTANKTYFWGGGNYFIWTITVDLNRSIFPATSSLFIHCALILEKRVEIY